MVSAWENFLCVFFSLKSRTPLPHFKDRMHGITFSVLPMTSVMFSGHHIPLSPLLTKLLRNFGPCCLLVSLYYKCTYLHICKNFKHLYKHKMSMFFHGSSPAHFPDVVIADALVCIFLVISHYDLEKCFCFYSVVRAHSCYNVLFGQAA